MTHRAEPAAVGSRSGATRTRLTFLDGVRALAALYVVLHHIWLTTYPDYPRNSGPVWTGWLAYGHLAVAVFIVVSGFSLTIAPARRGYELGGVRRFLRRRAWRILPPYWAALVFSCVVFGVVTRSLTGQMVTAKAFVVHALLLQDVVDSPKPNGAFWSIAVEWQIYFLFPLVLLAWRWWGGVVTVAVATASVLLAVGVAHRVPAADGILNLTPQFFVLFVLGVAAAGLTAPGRVLPRWVAPAALLSSVAALVLLAERGSEWVDRHYLGIDLLVGVAVACTLALLADGRLGLLRNALAGRLLDGIGLYSYSVYLVHLPLLWLTYHFGVDRLGLGATGKFLVLVAAGIPVVLAGSYAFHLAFERPFLRHRSFGELLGRSGGAVPAVAGPGVQVPDPRPAEPVPGSRPAEPVAGSRPAEPVADGAR